MERRAVPKHLSSGVVEDGFSVHREIERKFLIAVPMSYFTSHPVAKKDVFQSYLWDQDAGKWLRLRQNGDYMLTIKGPGDGLTRREAEKTISKEDYELLRPLADRSLRKTRYEIPYGKYTMVFDIYKGTLRGRQTLEIEFPTVKEAKAFRPPVWFGEDVTHDRRYKNRKLAKYGMPVDPDPVKKSNLRKLLRTSKSENWPPWLRNDP